MSQSQSQNTPGEATNKFDERSLTLAAIRHDVERELAWVAASSESAEDVEPVGESLAVRLRSLRDAISVVERPIRTHRRPADF